MLKSIIIVTIAVLNLESVETAYQEEFAYTTVEQSAVTKELAGVWDAPHMEGKEYLLMKADSETNVFLRFVELPAVQGYAPVATHGWNATELLVKDTDAMAAQLEESAFEIIGAPEDLWPNGPRAMQVLGPGNEIVYLTRNEQFSTSAAVDRVFIMVLGGPSMAAFSDFYGGKLGLQVGDATPFEISVISNAQGRPADTTYPLAVATISQDFLVELDEYPAGVPARPFVTGEIPPGVSMVTFIVDKLDTTGLEFRAKPAALRGKPYDGRRAGVAVGPAGEWLELIENPMIRRLAVVPD